MWESGDAISCAIYDTPEMKAERAALRHDTLALLSEGVAESGCKLLPKSPRV